MLQDLKQFSNEYLRGLYTFLIFFFFRHNIFFVRQVNLFGVNKLAIVLKKKKKIDIISFKSLLCFSIYMLTVNH